MYCKILVNSSSKGHILRSVLTKPVPHDRTIREIRLPASSHVRMFACL